MRKMLRASMIDIRPGSKFDTRLSAGAFCLVKPDGTLRLICDRRAGNSFEKLIGKARLPNPSRLSRILLPKSHCIRMSSRDLKDYYFALGVSEQRKLRQAWGPRIPSSWLDDLNNESCDYAENFENWWQPDLTAIQGGVEAPEPPAHFLQVVAAVVMMGELNAVYVAQEVHLDILTKAGVFEGCQTLVGDFAWERDNIDLAGVEGKVVQGEKALAGVYIDDLLVLLITPSK